MTSHRLHRRTFLAAGATSAVVAGPWLGGSGQAYAADEFDTLAVRWRDLMTGGTFDPELPAFAAALASLEESLAPLLADWLDDPTGDQVFTSQPLTGGSATDNTANAGNSYVSCYSIALAWATPGTSIHADATVAERLSTSLRTLHRVSYNPTLPQVGNWWFWQIGNPKRLLDTCVLLRDVMPAADLADYLATVRKHAPNPNFRGSSATSAETGANRTDKALACAVRGILGRSAAELAMARDALSDVVGGGRNSVFRYVTSGDGFYRDGSFIQHSYLPYVGSYGTVALSGVAGMLALLGGSTWQVDDPDRGVILDAPIKAFAPFIHHGLMLDTVRGRAVSRQSQPSTSAGFGTISSMLLMATSLDAARAETYRSLAKGWIERSPDDYLAEAGIAQIARALPVIDGDVEPTAEPVTTQHFWNQDRIVHRRPGWLFTVSTSSTRIGRYEWGNRENNLGWYQGDGMTWLSLADDLTQFDDDFWPTVDPYRLPGTTVDLAPRASGEADGTGIPRAFRAWAGGITLAERWASIGMDHLNHDKTLSGVKSWFCLDEEVVCLGAGITSTGSHPVTTVVENRNLHGADTATLLVDGRTRVRSVGDSETLQPTWAHLDGVGGYLFGRDSRLTASRTRRTGTWRAINSGGDTGGDTVERTRPYVTLALDHGTAPHAASYHYTMLPGASATTTRRRSTLPTTAVLANRPSVQAIRSLQRGALVWLANFFTADAVDTVSASAACAVALAVRDSRRSLLSVSDPSRTTGMLTLRLAGYRGFKATGSTQVTARDEAGALVLSIDLAGAAGAPVEVALTR